MKVTLVIPTLPIRHDAYKAYKKLTPYYKTIENAAINKACKEQGITVAAFESLDEDNARKQAIYARYDEIASTAIERFHCGITNLDEES